jgi:hypothetical protein
MQPAPSAPSSGSGPGCGDTIPADNLISDFEDGGSGIAQVAGRNGGWYVYNDGKGTQTPAAGGAVSASPNGACGSKFAFRTTGMGFSMWGAGMGTDLAPSTTPGKKVAYNLGQYTGIRFLAKAAAPVAVRVKLQDMATTPTMEGGACAAMCYDNFGKVVSLGTDWAKYEIKWSEMAQEGWGAKATLDPSKVLGIQLQFAMSVNFDFSIDNIAFIK